MSASKQMETVEKVIGENVFYIRPFAAFTAANISGDLAKILTPMIGGLLPAVAGALSAKEKMEKANDNDENNVLDDIEVEDIADGLSHAFEGLSGDKVERMMKRLLIDSGNIAYENEDTNGKAVPLTYNAANEIFCGEVQDMYILCAHVIALNFKGFFKRLGVQSGVLQKVMELVKMAPGMKDMENSTSADSENSN